MLTRKYNGVQNELVTKLRDFDYEVVCGSSSTSTYPEEYEIPRENTGTLKDQGMIGACVAETCVQIAEEWYRRELGEREEHSEGHFYGANRAENSTGYGMIPSDAMDKWVEKGTLPKKYFDLLVEMPDMKTLLKDYPEFEEEAKKYKLKGYVNLRGGKNTTKDKQIKEALMKYQYGLVAISPDGFTGGSHCIQLTGWNDKTNKYKFKNSWGKNYGDNGFSEIAKDRIAQVYLPLFEDVKLPFSDVQKTDWFYGDVRNMYFAGIINGLTETLFGPNETVTRAQVAAMMNRILKEIDERFATFSKVLEDKKEYFN